MRTQGKDHWIIFIPGLLLIAVLLGRLIIGA